MRVPSEYKNNPNLNIEKPIKNKHGEKSETPTSMPAHFPLNLTR